MKKVAVCFVWLSLFWVLQTALAQRRICTDLNGFVPGLAPAGITDAWLLRESWRLEHFTAVSAQWQYYPAQPISFDIRRGLFNVAAGDRLDVLVIDSFRPLNGQLLVHQNASDICPSSSRDADRTGDAS